MDWLRLDWLRRLLGESSELTRVREQNVRLARRVTKLENVVEDRENRLRKIEELSHRLLEPAQTDCRKVRLRTKAEALQYAEYVTRNLHEAMEPYKCRRCPRNPVTMAHFWHITHTDVTKRGKNTIPATVTPRPVDTRSVTSADVADLHKRFNSR